MTGRSTKNRLQLEKAIDALATGTAPISRRLASSSTLRRSGRFVIGTAGRLLEDADNVVAGALGERLEVVHLALAIHRRGR